MIADSSSHGKCCSCCCGGGGGGDHFGSAFLANVQSKVWNFSFSFLMYSQKGQSFAKNGCIKGETFSKKWLHHKSHNSMPKLTPQLSERIPFLLSFPQRKNYEGYSVCFYPADTEYCYPGFYSLRKHLEGLDDKYLNTLIRLLLRGNYKYFVNSSMGSARRGCYSSYIASPRSLEDNAGNLR